MNSHKHMTIHYTPSNVDIANIPSEENSKAGKLTRPDAWKHVISASHTSAAYGRDGEALT